MEAAPVGLTVEALPVGLIVEAPPARLNAKPSLSKVTPAEAPPAEAPPAEEATEEATETTTAGVAAVGVEDGLRKYAGFAILVLLLRESSLYPHIIQTTITSW